MSAPQLCTYQEKFGFLLSKNNKLYKIEFTQSLSINLIIINNLKNNISLSTVNKNKKK